jgi:hypothetical protein
MPARLSFCFLLEQPLFMLGWLALKRFVTLDRGRRPDSEPRPALHFLRDPERLRLARFGGQSSLSARVTRIRAVAEVCRNRTDRSRKARPAGFEVPDGHQPACTSALEFALGNASPARRIVVRPTQAIGSRWSLPPSASGPESAATRIASGHSLESLAKWEIGTGVRRWVTEPREFFGAL